MSRVRKVLVVNKFHFLSGGAERYFLSIAEALRARGVGAIPLSIRYSETLPTPYERYFVEPAIPEQAARIARTKPGFMGQLRLAQQVIYNPRVKEAVRKIHEDFHPDVAYLLNINNHLSPSVIDACIQYGVPVVMRLSDFNLVCASNMYYRDGHPCMDCKKGFHHALIHRCVHGSLARTAVGVFANSVHRWIGVYQRVSAFVTPTHFMKNELRELGFPSDRIFQINTFASPEPDLEPDFERPSIIYVGRFVEYKGGHLAIRAFAQSRCRQRVRLVLVGDERDEESVRLKRLVEELRCPNVEFVPFESQKQKVVERIQRSLFVLVPSLFYENLPNVILEAFSCGRPVVATRFGSIPEVVQDGKNGLLFEYGNAADLSSKIDSLVENESFRWRLGKNATEAVLSDYSEDQHLRNLMQVFEDAAESGRLGERSK